MSDVGIWVWVGLSFYAWFRVVLHWKVTHWWEYWLLTLVFLPLMMIIGPMMVFDGKTLK